MIVSWIKIILLSSHLNLPTIIEDLCATHIDWSLMGSICVDMDIVLKTIKDIRDCHIACIV
jgi:hypothetical protein